MKIDDCFQLGHIIKPFGIQGALSIFLDTDNPGYYEKLESVFVEYKQRLVPFLIEQLDIQHDRVTLKLRDIDDIDTAKQYKGSSLYLPLKILPPLEPHQFYYHEVIGFRANDLHLGDLGEIKSVYEGSGNDLFSIDYKNTEILVPIQDQFIISLDRQKRTIQLDLPEGLVDLYLNS